MPDTFFGWWGDMDLRPHIWDVLCRSTGGIVDVIFHEPLTVRSFSDRKTLAEECQRMVSEGHRDLRPVAARSVAATSAAARSGAAS